VNIASGSALIGAYQVTITFNKNLVTLAAGNVTGGNGAGFGSFTAKNIDNATGTLVINNFVAGSTASGNFTVANLVFTPIRAGTTTVTPSGITVTDEAGNSVSSSFLTLSVTSLNIN
jgi:hypothetical protein